LAKLNSRWIFLTQKAQTFVASTLNKNHMKTLIHSVIACSSFLFATQTKATEWEHLTSLGCELPSNSITALEKDANGTWIGTEDGLSHFDGANWAHYTESNSSLPTNAITALHLDSDGGLWVGTYNGLAYFHDNAWEVFSTSNSGIPSNLIKSVTTDQSGVVWIGTWGAGLAKLEGDEWYNYTAENSELPSNGIYSVQIDEQNGIWIGTFGGGVATFKNESWTVYNNSNSALPNDHVHSIVFGNDESVWVGTENGVAKISRSNELEWSVYNNIYFGHGVHAFRDAVQDSNGVLWFATDAGVLKYDGTSFHFFHTENSDVASNNCSSVTTDVHGNVFIGHAQHGLSVYNPMGVTLPVPSRFERVNFEMFPNPANDELTVKIPVKGDMNLNLIITDMMGRVVLNSGNINGKANQILQKTVDVSQLPSGSYLMNFQTHEGAKASPFLKL
jgi:ligand-binding sensor domain-containing protein